MIGAAVLWDLDGTLVDSEPVHLAALLDVLTDAGYALDPGAQQSMVGRSADEVYRFLRNAVGLSIAFDTLVQWKFAAYRRRTAELRPRPGGVSLFRALAQQGVRQAVISNSDRLLVDVNLQAIGLDHPGLVSISRNDVRNGKPDGEPYLRAAWLVNAAAADCLVIEDSATGAVAGLAAGMQVFVWPEVHAADDAYPSGVVLVTAAAELEQLVRKAIDLGPLGALNRSPSRIGAQ